MRHNYRDKNGRFAPLPKKAKCKKTCRCNDKGSKSISDNWREFCPDELKAQFKELKEKLGKKLKPLCDVTGINLGEILNNRSKWQSYDTDVKDSSCLDDVSIGCLTLGLTKLAEDADLIKLAADDKLNMTVSVTVNGKRVWEDEMQITLT